jgi:hypothetical protein
MTQSNSRIITIYRKESFIANAQRGTAPEFMAQSKQSIGSYWDNSHSLTVGTGLTFEEQRILLPEMVDCEPEDRNFRAKVKEYYQNMRTIVPFKEGRKLEVGLLADTLAPVSEKNKPLNLADYLAYRHALKSPEVSPTREAAERNMLTKYYIFDPLAAELKDVAKNAARDKALETYLLVKKEPKKVDMLLTLLLVDPYDPKKFAGANKDALKAEKLKSLVESDPKSFMDAYENKFFEETYLVKTLCKLQILREVGSQVIDLETGRTLGHDMTETAAWIHDEANNERLLLLKARMQEALKPVESATQKAV